MQYMGVELDWWSQDNVSNIKISTCGLLYKTKKFVYYRLHLIKK
jgi:hypothetical protein